MLFSKCLWKVIVFFYLIELESSKKQAEADKKAIDDLVRERDILNKVFMLLKLISKSRSDDPFMLRQFDHVDLCWYLMHTPIKTSLIA